MGDAKSFLVVGGGKMGEAILSGWIASDKGPALDICAEQVSVVEPSEDRRAYLTDTHGVSCVADVAHAPCADVIVLSVKPQVMMGMLEDLCANPAFAGADGESARPLFVSIAAGLTTASIEAALPQGSALVRVMPNMPLSIGAGASGVCGGTCATDEDVTLVAQLFGCLGRAVVVDEGEMDVVCALSGSGPAYVAAMIEALRDAAEQQGLARDLAETLAIQTVLGTARLIDETELTPETARVAVCSPGGTTLAALDAMNQAGFAHVFDEGVKAAVRRSKELASC